MYKNINQSLSIVNILPSKNFAGYLYINNNYFLLFKPSSISAMRPVPISISFLYIYNALNLIQNIMQSALYIRLVIISTRVLPNLSILDIFYLYPNIGATIN